jgi:hypothetical protein
MTDVRTFLEDHLQSIFDSDIETYHATTAEDLTLYEWFVTPHRINGLPFHDFMILEAGRDDASGIALDPKPDGASIDKPRLRFDLANYHEQVYGDVAICSYTLLLSRGTKEGVDVSSYNESRVLIQESGAWKVVHVHKSPSWKAPFQAPSE